MHAFVKPPLLRILAAALSALLAFASAANAQSEEAPLPPPTSVAPPAQPAFSQQELDQMLAPIALYPDPLLSQILMASTYPLEVVEAARWSRSNPSLRGDAAVKAIERQDWDPSVKSLVAFPQILQMMDEKLDWTERLGDAFLAQESQVMDTVQGLRQRAYAAGNLTSTDQIRVEQQGQTITVEPANPDLIYVPYYDPTVVYGTWWWYDYPPIFWAPWPEYYYQSGFAWGIGITITTGFFFADCDWRHRRVNVVNVNNFYYNRIEHGERHPPRVNRAPGVWHHDPDHRRGVPYRDASLRRQFERGPASPDARREYRGYAPPSSGAPEAVRNIQPEPRSAPARPNRRAEPAPSPAPVPRTAPAETPPPAGGGQTVRQFEQAPHVRPSMPREVTRPSAEVRPHAFEGIGRGSEVRDSSARGHSSFEGMTHRQGSVPAQRPPSISVPAPRPSERGVAPQPSAPPGGGRGHSRHQGN